ncbi:hypothetical protein, partial [Salmonella sp. s51090]|uniref:hypothetical protein n=1 Tax=Salmonella sp. s51090 TaxID=3159651 RepID=UPI00398009A3
LTSLFYVFGVDYIRVSLIFLSCWLLPLTLLARQGHMRLESDVRQRIYCVLLVLVLVSLVFTFRSLELSLFYISFESTLIPILVIISRWGSQYARYQ